MALPKHKENFLVCMFCPFITDDEDKLLEHEELVHGEMVAALQNEDGTEEEEQSEDEEE